MKVYLMTIVLDGMPFIKWHYPIWKTLPLDWEWHVVEGVAKPKSDTSWVANIPARLSTDGTTEYLREISDADKRIKIQTAKEWPGKTAMCNAALSRMKEPGILFQMDADEIWSADQIVNTIALFNRSKSFNAAFFRCRYFLGPDIVITSRDTYGNHSDYEWVRAWRFLPGQRFERHEPPKLGNGRPLVIPHHVTEFQGIVFDHFAYATEEHVRFKEQYYGTRNNSNGDKYRGAVEKWRKLQRNNRWPAKVKEFLPWVTDNAVCERIKL